MRARANPGMRLPQLSAPVAAALLAAALLSAGTPHGAGAIDCSLTSVGLTPLTDLGTGFYQDFQGGLYPGGANERPEGHTSAGLERAAEIVPRDQSGAPDPVDGWIVLLTVGMSNTSRESTALIALAENDPEKAPRVTLVNGAQGGQTAADIADPDAEYWHVIDARLAGRNLSRAQVQAIWFKEANRFPNAPFPEHADTLTAQFVRIMHIIHDRFPNALLCYCSSRIYAGYATTGLNPEPWAYESGFAVKKLVEEQIAGEPALNFDPASGPVRSPWLSWASYLWADGLVPRGDGLIWECADFDTDGTHPSQQGAFKAAALLLGLFKQDPTSAGWFLRAEAGLADQAATRASRSALQALPNPARPPIMVPLVLEAARDLRIEVRSMAASGERIRTLFDGRLAAGVHGFAWDGTNAAGRAVPAGSYLIRILERGRPVAARKAVLIR